MRHALPNFFLYVCIGRTRLPTASPVSACSLRAQSECPTYSRFCKANILRIHSTKRPRCVTGVSRVAHKRTKQIQNKTKSLNSLQVAKGAFGNVKKTSSSLRESVRKPIRPRPLTYASQGRIVLKLQRHLPAASEIHTSKTRIASAFGGHSCSIIRGMEFTSYAEAALVTVFRYRRALQKVASGM